MSLTDSPPVEYYDDGMPVEKEPSPLKRNWLRVMLIGITLIVAIIAIAGLINRQDLILGRGSISGQVIDNLGQPIANAEVFASQCDTWAASDLNGHFQLEGIPAGKRVVVVVVTPMPELDPIMLDVDIPAGETLELGQLVYGQSAAN